MGFESLLNNSSVNVWKILGESGSSHWMPSHIHTHRHVVLYGIDSSDGGPILKSDNVAPESDPAIRV
jgi:hypothetical protein